MRAAMNISEAEARAEGKEEGGKEQGSGGTRGSGKAGVSDGERLFESTKGKGTLGPQGLDEGTNGE